jgi:hypothetical protein
MLVKQISVFIENKAGRLADVATCLANEGIDTRALSLADTTNFGVLRLIVDQPEKALEVLKDCNFAVSITDVISVLVPDVPGGLAEVLKIFNERNLDIEYMYAFIGKESGKAIVILRVDKPEEAIEKLKDTNIF